MRFATDSHHVYVHVPFCRLVCAYCDFVTVGGRADAMPRYVAGLLRELACRPAPGRLATIYFGGGTPSLLPAADVAAVIDAADARWGSRASEITLEANPSAREIPDWPGLRAAGVNRISLGVQALRDDDLRALARGHTVDEVLEAYAAARAAGFDNISIDLIYGIPGQDLDAWRDGLRRAVALGPDHLSLYALQLALAPDEWAAPPRDGALRWRRRLVARQDEELAADQYATAEELLDAAGYRHYELSSWARPGRESRHNTAYWRRRPYTGIGAGAHSYDGEALRSWTERDLDTYLNAVEADVSPRSGSETLDPATRAFEALALGLREVDGLDVRDYAAEFGATPADRHPGAWERVRDARLIEEAAGRLRLTARGRLLASEVLLEFLPVAKELTAVPGPR
jgi:oxygen-independent coproporphyrinogen-3 oxidase